MKISSLKQFVKKHQTLLFVSIILAITLAFTPITVVMSKADASGLKVVSSSTGSVVVVIDKPGVITGLTDDNGVYSSEVFTDDGNIKCIVSHENYLKLQSSEAVKVSYVYHPDRPNICIEVGI